MCSELSVPVDMMAALQALAIDLAAIAEAFEQLRDPGRRDPMPQAFQRQRELRMALGDPYQRPRRVAERRRLQKAAQVFQQRGIGSRERRPSAAGAANLRARAIGRRQILQAAIDRAARDSGRPRHGAHAAVSGRARLRRREQPPLPFVQTHPHRLETVANRCFINHAAVIAIRSKIGNPHRAVDPWSAHIQVDSIVLRRHLSVRPGLDAVKEDAMTELAEQTRDVISFGPFSLVASERLLTKDGALVELGARTFDALLALASRPNEVLS